MVSSDRLSSPNPSFEDQTRGPLKVPTIRLGPVSPERATEVKSILDESVPDAVVELAASCPDLEHFGVELRAIPRPPEPWDPADEPEPTGSTPSAVGRITS